MTLAEAGPVERALDEAERDVVAAVLYGATPRLPEVARTLRPDDFGNPRFRAVWEAVLRLDARGDATDAASVAVELGRREDQAVRIDRSDLVALADESAIPSALPTYVRHVEEASRRRRLRTVQTMLAQAETLGDPQQAIEHARRAAEVLRGAITTASHAKLPYLHGRMLGRSALADLPQPEPRIADTIDKRTVVVLSGRRGKGKSVVALDWANSIVTGRRWQGRDVEPSPVLWIAAEGAFGMNRRVTAWEYAWQHKVTDLHTLPLPVNLYTGKHVDELVQIVADMRPGLVVFDTWARCTVGGKENDNSDATVACDRLEPLRHLDASVLLIAHTDADDTKTRGATALEDNVDIVYRLKGDENHLVLARTKRKDGPEHDELHLRLRVVNYGTGDHDNSVIVESANAVDMAGRTADLMSIFDEHFADIGCSKKELRDVAAENGITSSGTFTRALKALVSAGALTNTGSDTRPFYKAGATS